MNSVVADEALQPYITAVANGDDDALISQVVAKSQEPAIKEFTPKDASKRFGTEEMFKAWKAGGRDLYWLIGQDGDLGGIIWYGKKAFPLDITLPEPPAETFAIRLYDGYSGHGLAVPAMKQTLRLHVQAATERGEPVSGLWLETDSDNPAAIHVYTKFGYHEVHRTAERVTMVLPASEIRSIVAS
jgi:GNAT superfamily N-acetyltransferase